MIAGGILAGGVGKRMGYTELPKQFLTLGQRPIIVHTVEKFLMSGKFDKVIIGCVKSYVDHTRDILKKHIGEDDRIVVIEGGADRNGTIANIIAHMRALGADDGSILVSHDAVRPFVSTRILEDNIAAAERSGVCDTAIPAYDTIVRTKDGKFLDEIPVRSEFWRGQTPQSFRIKYFEDDYGALSDEDKQILTDACKIFVLAGRKVEIVEGEPYNMKVTTPYDLKIGEAMVSEVLDD